MGFIHIPKIIQSGGGDEPVIDARDMPDEWKYFTTLKEDPKDQAYLMFKGCSNCFTISGVNTTNTTVTIYGGADGKQPLYQYLYASSTTNRKWYHWDSSTQTWVKNTTQTSTTNLSNAKFMYGDMDNFPSPYFLSLDKLTGKAITNDPHLGNTELFTVIVHKPNAEATSQFLADTFFGGNSSTGAFSIPVVAYSGYAKGIRASSSSVNIQHLEFVEFLGGTEVNIYSTYDSEYLGKITVPNSVTTIGNDAFAKCSYLQEIEFGTGVTTIPQNCCLDCSNLRKVTIPSGITTIGDFAFNYCYSLHSVDIPNTVTTIGNDVFSATGIRKMTFPSSVVSFGDDLLPYTPLEEVKILGNATLGRNAFVNCYQLKKVVLNDNITAIPDYFCNHCRSLSEISLPSALTSIGLEAFAYCENLEEITVPSGVTFFDISAFNGCTRLKKASLPNGLSDIGNSCFNNCYSLREVNIPTSLTQLQSYLFANCKSLEEINIPEGILSISTYVFYGCASLPYIILPSTIQSIAGNTFSYTSRAFYIKLKSTTPPTLSATSAFANTNTYMKILIPYENINDYQTTTNWSSTSSNIKTRQRGYGYFTANTTLPATTTDGLYNLTWYDNINYILKTAHNVTPTETPVTVASADGEYWCTFTHV